MGHNASIQLYHKMKWAQNQDMKNDAGKTKKIRFHSEYENEYSIKS